MWNIFPYVFLQIHAIQSGKIPLGMKIEKAVPIDKSKEKYIFNNYRPILVLPVLSKFQEGLYIKGHMVKGYMVS